MQPSRSSVAKARFKKTQQDKKEKEAETEQRAGETKMLVMSEVSTDSELFVSKEKTTKALHCKIDV